MGTNAYGTNVCLPYVQEIIVVDTNIREIRKRRSGGYPVLQIRQGGLDALVKYSGLPLAYGHHCLQPTPRAYLETQRKKATVSCHPPLNLLSLHLLVRASIGDLFTTT